MMDREDAHSRLDALLDKLDEARTANSPQTTLDREKEATALFGALSSALMAKVYSRRRGLSALRLDLATVDSVDMDTAILVGEERLDLTKLNSLEGDDREALLESLADTSIDAEASGVFQPGLGGALAATLLYSNAKVDDAGKWLRPRGGSGSPLATPDRAVRLLAVQLMAYRAAYMGTTEPKIWRKVFEDQLKIKFATISKSWVRDREFRLMHEDARRQGLADRDSGLPYNERYGHARALELAFTPIDRSR